MSCNGSQVVFLIHPNKLKDVGSFLHWQELVLQSILKVLFYLENSSSSNRVYGHKVLTKNKQNNDLKWGYKCVRNSDIKFNCLHQTKGVSLKNVQDLKKEIYYNEKDSIDYCAHTLATNLVAIVHDFQWENLEIISPVKLPKKLLNASNAESLTNKTCCHSNQLNDNFVIVIGPLPKSQIQLNEYFEWQINTVDDIEKILMPKDLAKHFQVKHYIRLFWLDTQTVFDKLESDDNDCNGYILLNDFLKKYGGSVIPLSTILNFKHETFDTEKEIQPRNLFSSNFQSTSDTSEINCSIGSDTVFENSVKDSSILSSYLPTSAILDYFCQPKNEKQRPESLVQKSVDLFFDDDFSTDAFSIKMKVQEMIPTKPSHSQKCLHSDNCCKLNKDVIDKSNTSFNKKLFHVSDSKDVLKELTVVSENLCNSLLNNLNKDSFKSKMHVVGTIPLLMISLNILRGLCCICKPSDNSFKFEKLLNYLHKNQMVLVVKKLFLCDDSKMPLVFQNTSLFSQFWILQPISSNCASLNLISETCKEEVLGLLNHGVDDGNSRSNAISQFLCNSSFDFEAEILNHESSTSSFSTTSKNDAKNFNPCMMESWYCLPSSSEKLLEAFQEDDQKPTCSDTANTEFRDSIMSELQQIYSRDFTDTAVQKSESLLECSKTSKNYCEFSAEEMISFVQCECEKSLELEIDQIQMIKKSASNIVSAVCDFMSKNKSQEDSAETEEKIKELAFVKADEIRGRCLSPLKKCTECAFQIHLRMEWLVREQSQTKDEYGEHIVQLLRIISLSSNVDRMKEFLCESLVDLYSESLGEFLVEIHNHLMIPLPNALHQFSSEFDQDESYYLSSVRSDRPPSSGPFSFLSSVGSIDSSDSFSNDRNLRCRRKPKQIKPVTTRQIEVPKRIAKVQQEIRRNSVPHETVKRLFANNDEKNEKPISSKSTSSSRRISTKQIPEEVNKVRRDLFTSPSKRKKKVENLVSPDKRKNSTSLRRHRSVVDTPAAKQRLTALARQKLRLRRSCTELSSDKKIVTVEESPLKPVENHPNLAASVSEPRVRRSPRHSIMLTRRHSFYRDGSYEKCRTVARAQVVQQHKEAVPPTPLLAQPVFASNIKNNEKSLISPKSLLFSYTGSNRESKSSQEQGRSRRRLKLVSDSTPVVSSPLVSSVSEMVNVASDLQQVSKLKPAEVESDSETVFPDAKSTQSKENSPPPFQSYLDDTDSMSPEKKQASPPIKKVSLPPPLKRMPSVKRDCSEANNNNYNDQFMSPPKLVMGHQFVVRRSPRLIGRVSSSPNQKVGPLDQFVIRTPTPNKPPKQTRSHSTSRTRRPSPIGDHIQKWPRRKRLLSASPNVLKRRPKLEVEADTFPSGSSIKDALTPSCSDQLSPGVDVESLLEHFDPTTNKRNLKPKQTSEDILSDMGVFPIGESEQTFKRWTSPRTKRSGLLFHAPVATKKSFVPMVLLKDKFD